MITITQVLAGFVVLGLIGSAVEKIGVSLDNHRVENVGKAIKSIASDAPGFISDLVTAVKAKK